MTNLVWTIAGQNHSGCHESLLGLSSKQVYIRRNRFIATQWTYTVLFDGYEENAVCLYTFLVLTRVIALAHRVNVKCSPDWKKLHIYKSRDVVPVFRSKRQSFAKVSDSAIFMQRRKKRDIAPHDNALDHEKILEQKGTQKNSNDDQDICKGFILPLVKAEVNKQTLYNISVSSIVKL